ncbi:hypothetical protein BD289DRAFT_435240 [Coniella lustricola]|uniref:NAD-dependent epimerase/dehydratase domain-containing protein n=1 Tax=Coniella lustricola TaxID=2025994 RepID=A0A2T3A6I0_9PEZI|nr:hypothetical protein BD289DRAFT_435240 [Coniella lustricola]
MKLIIAGSTGFVGTELVRQALLHPRITSVVALGRRETCIPAGVNSEDAKKKLIPIVSQDFGQHSDATKKVFEGAGAVIWTVAVTPFKLKDFPWDEVIKVSREDALATLKVISKVNSSTTSPSQPLRYIYMSGFHVKRDRAEAEKNERLKQMPLMLDYIVMRGDAEQQCVDFAKQSNGKVEVAITRPGLVQGPDRERRSIPGVPDIEVEEVAAAQLEQVLNGFESEVLGNDDLVRIARKAWEARGQA